MRDKGVPKEFALSLQQEFEIAKYLKQIEYLRLIKMIVLKDGTQLEIDMSYLYDTFGDLFEQLLVKCNVLKLLAEYNPLDDETAAKIIDSTERDNHD